MAQNQPTQPRPYKSQSLSQLLRKHKDNVEDLQREADTNRRHVVASMNKVSDSMVDGINQGVARVFANQRKIGQETKYLENESMKLHKQTNMWIQLIEDFNNALKEIGDVENWAQVIENDMKEVSSALEHVYRLSNPSVTNTE